MGFVAPEMRPGDLWTPSGCSSEISGDDLCKGHVKLQGTWVPCSGRAVVSKKPVSGPACLCLRPVDLVSPRVPQWSLHSSLCFGKTSQGICVRCPPHGHLQPQHPQHRRCSVGGLLWSLRRCLNPLAPFKSRVSSSQDSMMCHANTNEQKPPVLTLRLYQPGSRDHRGPHTHTRGHGGVGGQRPGQLPEEVRTERREA